MLNLFKKDILLSFNCHAIATIQSFSSDDQTVSASINYKRSYQQAGADGVYQTVLVDYPLLIDVPAVILFPHILIGHAHERPMHTMGGTNVGMGWQVIVRVHIYSQYQGDKEALRILDRVVTLLNYASLSIAGYGTVICEYTMGRVLIEASKDKIETRHIPTEFTVRVHQ